MITKATAPFLPQITVMENPNVDLEKSWKNAREKVWEPCHRHCLTLRDVVFYLIQISFQNSIRSVIMWNEQLSVFTERKKLNNSKIWSPRAYFW